MCFRCSAFSCRKRFNVLSFASWLPQSPRQGRGMTPVMLLALLRAWTASGLCQTPSAYVLARQIGSTYKPVSKVLRQLLDLEATAGKDYNESLKLRGYVEVDATSIRCIRVYPSSVRFKSLIQDWIARHPLQRCLSLNIKQF